MATPTNFDAAALCEMMLKVGHDERPLGALLLSGGMRARLEKGARINAPMLTDASMFRGFTQTYMGFPVTTVDIPPEKVMDWSGCRSPSRAKRRYARGLPQRVRVTYRECAFLIDPRILTDSSNRFDRMAVKMLLGGGP